MLPDFFQRFWDACVNCLCNIIGRTLFENHSIPQAAIYAPAIYKIQLAVDDNHNNFAYSER